MTGRSDLFCSRLGTSFEAKRWLSLDPCGLFCISFSVTVHLFALTVIALFLIQTSIVSQSIFFGIYCPAAFMALWSLFTAWTTNPGAVPFGARPLTTVKMAGSNTTSSASQKQARAIRRCAKCNDNYKPPRAHHDSVTGRCIVKMDHYWYASDSTIILSFLCTTQYLPDECTHFIFTTTTFIQPHLYSPWVCNAVGALNHKFFVLFIGYTLLTSILSIILIVFRMLYCSYLQGNQIIPNSAPGAETTQAQVNWSTEHDHYDPSRSLINDNTSNQCSHLYDNYLVIALCCVSVAFMIFTCCMLFEQVEAIESNQGKIARMKMKIGQGGTELERVTYDFNEMFGGTTAHATWHWFIPLQVTYPDNMLKVVLGYEWDPTFEQIYQENDMVAAVVGDGVVNGANSDGDVEQGGTKAEATDNPGKEDSDHSKQQQLQDRSNMKKRSVKKPDDRPDFIDRTVSID